MLKICALLGIVGLITGALVLDTKLAPGMLLDPINPALSRAVRVAGLCAAAMLSLAVFWRITARDIEITASAIVNLVCGLAIVCFILPAAMLRDGVQMAAFAGVATPIEVRPFVVTGTHISWWSKRSNYYVDVRLPLGEDAVALRATKDAYDAVQAGDRIDLPYQVGRNDIRRIIAPNPLKLADLHAH